MPRPVEASAPVELEMALGGITLAGTSVAARATAFAVPELGVALDIGRLTLRLAAQPVVLLSHGHLDHLAGVLAYLNVRARFHAGVPPRVVAPRGVAEPLLAALAVMPGVESVRKRLRLKDTVLWVEPGEAVAVPGGTATAFAVDHGAPALGWALRRPGERRPCLVYAGDGTVEPFRGDPGLLDAATAVVECTFAGKNRRIAARLARHAHVLDWTELAPALRCDRLVLAHLPPLPSAELAALTAPLAEAFAGELVLWAAP
jgi:ribonuclease BN (tRNA processing enzyme)